MIFGMPALALVLALGLIVPAGTARAAATPVPTPIAAIAEIAAGSAAGALLGYAVGKGILAGGDCETPDGPFGGNGCSDQVGLAFLGMYVGYAVGNPLGILASGSALGQGGSGLGAFLGGALGQVIALPIAFLLASDDGKAALPLLIVFPAVIGTWTYHAARPPAQGGELAFSETTLRLRGIRPMPSPGMRSATNRAGGFRAPLAEFHF